MSRCITLEEYLQQFVDDNTEQSVEDVRLLVTNQQAQELGFFLIQGLAGFVESVRLQRSCIVHETPVDENGSEAEESDEFIN